MGLRDQPAEIAVSLDILDQQGDVEAAGRAVGALA
jgi:hypothetical protein